MSENSLVEIRKTSALEVFTTPEKIEAVLARVEEKARKVVVGTVDTAKGRKEIASLAYKVAQTKTYIDEVGKELVAEMKELPKQIDANRKLLRERLDALRDELRAPLDAWEAAEAEAARQKAEAEAAAKARAERIASDIRSFIAAPSVVFGRASSVITEHMREIQRMKPEPEGYDDRFEEALRVWTASIDSMNVILAQTKEREQFEKDQHDRRIAAEAEERARVAAEQKVLDARLAQERAEREKEAALQQAFKQAEEAAQRERERLEAEQRRVEEEARKRAADHEHRKRVNNEALRDLLAHCVIADDQAKSVIKAIASGKVSHITLSY